jgi:hypothetical protein
MNRSLTVDRQDLSRLISLLRANGIDMGHIPINGALIDLLNAEAIPFVLHCTGGSAGEVLKVDNQRVFRGIMVQNNSETACAICLESLAPKDHIVRLLCKHMFHDQCVDAWVQTKNECPLCRAMIPAMLC